MTAKKVLGIDLGTTYSCVAYVNQYGKPEVILNRENERTTPSVVWFDGQRAIVGREAKEMGSIHPDFVCGFIKRQMGNDQYTFDVDGIQYSPEHISSLILRKLVQDAWARIGEEVRDVVITCPAYFFVKERDATKLAGEQAGLNVLQIVNEPTAAAIAYGIQPERTGSSEVILVYDLGGGTFDVTIMKTSPAGLDVICTDGDHQLGGKDWDDQLARFFARRFEEETGIPVDLAGDSEFYYDLMQQAEETKKHLSEKTSVTVRINHEGQKVRFEMTREEFENITASLLERTIDLTLQCCEVAAEKGIGFLDRVILVGGSSRMPQVAAKLTSTINATPDLFDPDEAVAKGAALIGNNIILKRNVEQKLTSQNNARSLLIEDATEPQKEAAMREVADETGYSMAIVSNALKTVRNVASKSFGCISTLEGDFRSVANIIYRNTPIPCEEMQTFTTVTDFQKTVLVELMENSQDRSNTYDQDLEELQNVHDQARFDELFWRVNAPEDESEKLWEGELAIQPGLRRGSPIDITFKLDENGLLTLTATDPASGNKLVQTIQTGTSHKNEEFKQATQHSRNLIVD